MHAYRINEIIVSGCFISMLNCMRETYDELRHPRLAKSKRSKENGINMGQTRQIYSMYSAHVPRRSHVSINNS